MQNICTVSELVSNPKKRQIGASVGTYAFISPSRFENKVNHKQHSAVFDNKYQKNCTSPASASAIFNQLFGGQKIIVILFVCLFCLSASSVSNHRNIEVVFLCT